MTPPLPPTAPDIRCALGAAIRTARINRSLRQEDLAEKSGMHRTYIGSVERGERNISIDNLYRIATALDMPLSDLLLDIPRTPTSPDRPTTPPR